MNGERRCPQCGVTNRPEARFCERCGGSIPDAAQASPLRSTETSPQPRRRFNRRYAVYVVVGLIVIAVIASLPWLWPRPDFTSQITGYFISDNYKIVTPFQHTTLNGADAYVGSASFVGNKSHATILENIQVFPKSSETDAQSLEQTLSHQFESQGFVEMSSTPGISWSGVSNDSTVGLAVVLANNSPTGAPAVLVLQTALPPLTTPGTTTTVASAQVQSAQSV
jgi:hypothetical protein